MAVTPKTLWPLWLVVVVGALWIGRYFGGSEQREADAEQIRTLEGAIHVVHENIVHYDTVLKTDTVKLRIASAHADTVRDTAWVVIVRLDSAARADSVVPASLAHSAALACSDAILSDSVALDAARAALRDCYAARTWSDSGRVLAERRAVIIETAAQRAVWTGRKQGFVVGALAALGLHLIVK